MIQYLEDGLDLLDSIGGKVVACFIVVALFDYLT